MENMAKSYIHEIPEGYEARIEGNKVIIELAESEDERIRKEIRNFLIDMECKEEWVAYLEKQKEPHYTKRNALFDKCVAECDPEIMQKVSDEIDEMLEKEQKPTTTEDMYIADEHFYERTPADSFKYKLAEYMTKNYRKAEGPYGHTYLISAETILKMAEEELLKRGVVQKPVEWNEEDEKMRVNILNALTPQLVYSVGKGTYTGTSTYKYDDEIKWLKSLRPSWKPSEEQMEHLQRAINCYESDWGENKLLRSLIYDLKKLM